MESSNFSKKTSQVEASRKRKALDFGHHSGSYTVGSHGFLAVSSANKECHLRKEPCSQTSVTPKEMISDSCWSNSQVFVPQDFNLAKASSEQSIVRSFPDFNFCNFISSIAEPMKDASLHEFVNSRISSMTLPQRKFSVWCGTFPSETQELSGTGCTTNLKEPVQAHMHTIVTGNHMMERQNPTQAFSMLKAKHTDYAMSGKPNLSLITFEGMNNLEFGNCAKDGELRVQSLTTKAQKPVILEPSSCEIVDQSYVTTDHPSLSPSDKNHQKEGRTSYRNAEHPVQDFAKAVEVSNLLSSHSLDVEMKSEFGQLSPLVCESLWDGVLQLSTSIRASALAFFKSGEKIQDIAWPRVVEIKGKVRLQAFDKFVQELPRSRNRSLMVISLCWKVGSSKAGLEGMKEVAKGFQVSEKVGFAQICPGFDLYVCPRSEAVITILAKYGFFKGISAVETNQNSLVGCIVWRRNPKPITSDNKKSEAGEAFPWTSVARAESPMFETPNSEGHQATSYHKSPAMASSTNENKIQDISLDKTQDVAAGLVSPYAHDESTNQRVLPTEAVTPTSQFKSAPTLVLQRPQVTPFKLVPSLVHQQLQNSPSQSEMHETPQPLQTMPEIQQHVRTCTAPHCGSLGMGNSVSHSEVMQNSTSTLQPDNAGFYRPALQSPVVPQRTIQSCIGAEKNLMVDSSGCITQHIIASSAAEPIEVQQKCPFLQQPNLQGARGPDDNDLPEFDFSTVCGAEAGLHVRPLIKHIARTFSGIMHPEVAVTKLSGPMRQPSLDKLIPMKPREQIAWRENFTNVVPKEIVNPVSNCSIGREKDFRKDDGSDDDDGMPEFHFPEIDPCELSKSSSTKMPLSSSKTIPDVKAPSSPVFPPITPRSLCLSRIEDFSYEHSPSMPSRWSNLPKDQDLFPGHHYPATAPRSFSSSRDHGKYHGTWSDQQGGILGQRPDAGRFSATHKLVRPHNRFAPSRAWRTLLPGAHSHYGSDGSDYFSGSHNRSDHYCYPRSRSGGRSTHSGH